MLAVISRLSAGGNDFSLAMKLAECQGRVYLNTKKWDREKRILDREKIVYFKVLLQLLISQFVNLVCNY